MSILSSCGLILFLLFHSGYIPSFPDGILTAKETRKFEKNADNLGERLEVYKDASSRMQKDLGRIIRKKEFVSVDGRLQSWILLLSESLKDIKSNIDPKKKRPKDLIKYEIQIRKALNDLKDFQMRAPYEQQDMFESCIDRADAIRGEIVDILFQPEKAVDGE